MTDRYTPWRLYSTVYPDRVQLIGTETEPPSAPAGGRRELSGDGFWLTIYGAAEPGHRPPVLETYGRNSAFRPSRPLS